MNVRKVSVKYGTYRWVTDDGFVFKFKRVLQRDSGRVVYMLCANPDCKGSCRVKFNSKYDDTVECGVIVKQVHTSGNCRNLNFSEAENIRQAMVRRAASENTANSKIFQEEISRAPLSVRNSINFKEIERSMQRAHRSNNPKSPKTLAELADLINQWEDKYGKVNEEPFFLGHFGSGSEECVIAVVPSIGKDDVMEKCDWHLDGTFKCRPKDPQFAQLYVIMATAFGRAFPIAWALMKSRTTKAYDVLFKNVKEYFPRMKPNNIMSDYEKALRASVKEHFPDACHLGCWFHFSQAIERNAKKLGIHKSEKDGWKVARRLMATALLPPERIEEAVCVIEGFAETTDQRDESKKLISYFRGEWMGKVTAASFSVYNQQNRTNNCQESLNRCINRTIRPQGTTWDFWKGLMQITTKEINYFHQLQGGSECTRKKKMKWLLQDRNIRALQGQLERGQITMAEFLVAASHRITANQRAENQEEGDNANDNIELPDEEVELGPMETSQDNLDGGEVRENVGQMPRAVVPVNYITRRVVLNFNTFSDCPEPSFTERQRNSLIKDFDLDVEQLSEADGRNVTCKLCNEYLCTRLFTPCGHWGGCRQCILKLVKTKVFFQTITLNGDTIDEIDFPLPVRCPQCQALVGKCVRVFIED